MEMVLDGVSKLGESLGGKLRPGRICKGAVLGGLRPPALNSAHFVIQIVTHVSVFDRISRGTGNP